MEERRLLTVDVSGNGNTTAASLLSAGGPGDVSQPGFVSVGKSSTQNASVTYLGNGWAITAAHVTLDNNLGPIRFGANSYQVDMGSIVQLRNPDNSLADVQLFRLTTDPGLPAILPSMISTVTPSGRQIMIGNGLNLGSQHFWNVDTSGATWVWTEEPDPIVPGPNDASGFDETGGRVIRWGENNVKATGLTIHLPTGTIHAYSTQFDNLTYTASPALTSEAQASSGDSGGAVFSFQGGQWVLAGIMNATGEYNNQPSATAVYGDQTYITDLSQYRTQILTDTAVTSSVFARKLFYAGSSRYDTTGNPVTPLPFSDDNAIATDKTAYLPGSGAATFANVSSYSAGINGIMIDIAGSHPNMTVNDFVFKVGNNNTPSTWAPAPAPLSMTVRPGAGVSGSDRVEFIWANNAIEKEWLEVISLANTNTGLAQSATLPAGQADAFFFGSAVGDSGLGDSATNATVNSTDEIGARDHSQALFNNIPITNIYDYNRDGIVNSTDQIIVRSNGTGPTTATRFINITSPPAAPDATPLASPVAETDPRGLSNTGSPAIVGSRPEHDSAGRSAAVAEARHGSSGISFASLFVHEIASRGRHRSAGTSTADGALVDAVWRQLADDL